MEYWRDFKDLPIDPQKFHVCKTATPPFDVGDYYVEVMSVNMFGFGVSETTYQFKIDFKLSNGQTISIDEAVPAPPRPEMTKKNALPPQTPFP
jgi:hypothetical protein